MAHLRLNERDTQRNELVNFISALDRYPNEQDALLRLRQLSAVFKPIMKKHGLTINSLEEYEPNPEFAGRNWNAGETIEMVLRTHNGSFLPFGLICGVFAHELAHNVHMNHVPSKHGALTSELSAKCRDLRRKGYHGDGFWSGGQRLGDRAWVQGEGEVTSENVPQSLCGGAWKKGSRGGSLKRRRHRRPADPTRKRRAKGVPSLHTGAQTSANTERTAGKRRAYIPLPGQGSRVDGQDHLPVASAKSDAYKNDPNSTFRKRANASSARDVRAAAAMRRIAVMQQELAVKPKLDDKDGLGAERESKALSEKQTALPGHTLPGHALPAQDDQVEQDSVTESESGTESETDDCELYESSDDEAADTPCGSAFGSGTAGVTDGARDASASSDAAPADTQSHTETDEQRKRRTQRFQCIQQEASQSGRDAHAGASSSASGSKGPGNLGGDEWSTLVKDSQREQRLQALDRLRSPADAPKREGEESCPADRAVGASKGDDDGDDDDDDDDVILVEVKKKAP